MPHKATDLLNNGAAIIQERGKVYGPPSANLGHTARLWTADLGEALNRPLTSADVARLMVHLKLSRLHTTPDHEDSWQDALNYMAIAGEESMKPAS